MVQVRPCVPLGPIHLSQSYLRRVKSLCKILRKSDDSVFFVGNQLLERGKRLNKKWWKGDIGEKVESWFKL